MQAMQCTTRSELQSSQRSKLPEEEKRSYRLFGVIAGLAAAGGLGCNMLKTLWGSFDAGVAMPGLEGTTEQLGRRLFESQPGVAGYLLPFEIVSLILLVAIVGVVLLSKKEVK